LNSKNTLLSNRKSAIVSFILALALIPALLFLLWYLPSLVNTFIDTPDILGNRELIKAWERTGILVAAYAMLVTAFAAVGFMLAILRTVLKNQIFSQTALRVLDCLTVCCFVEGALLCYVGIYFQVALCLAIAALYLGVSLRVIKNVIAEAMRYKEENDLTV
jgi:intracellular septation protein A